MSIKLPKDKTLISDIEKLTREKLLTADDADVEKLKNALFAARLENNPYRAKVNGCDEGSLLFSFINMQRDYMTKFIATGFLAFMRRAVNEWGVPDAPVSVPVIDVVDFLKDPTLADPVQAADGSKLDQATIDAYNENKKLMGKRIIVAEFLEYFFGFDPDRHARPGYKPNFKDTERRPIMSASGELSVLLEKKRLEKDKKASRSEKAEAAELYEKYKIEQAKIAAGEVVDKPCVHKVVRTIKGKNGATKQIERAVKCTETEYKIIQMKAAEVLDEKNMRLVESEQKVIPVGSPEWQNYFAARDGAKDAALHDVVRDLIPPADMFYKFNNYLDKHYEQIQSAVRDLYHEKPDFDASIYPYKLVKPIQHPKNGLISIEEQVKKFRHENARDIFFGINEVKCGSWSIIAPHKQNRDRVEYYGQNMAIFEEMFKMKAAEKALAKDMLDKPVARKRRAIQAQHGKNDPAFDKEYGTIGGSNLDSLGVSKLKDNTDNEIEQEEDDAIRVGVFRFSQGGKKLDVSEFLTESEAPDFMAKH